jgi:hypothetical protein
MAELRVGKSADYLADLRVVRLGSLVGKMAENWASSKVVQTVVQKVA